MNTFTENADDQHFRRLCQLAASGCTMGYLCTITLTCVFPSAEGQATISSYLRNNWVTLGWLTLAPALWCCRTPQHLPTLPSSSLVLLHRRWMDVISALVIVTASLLVSRYTSTLRFEPALPSTFDNSPPLLHDEYSYLFQAATYSRGRLYNHSHPGAAELFDSMHVLNDGKWASRYFAGTGLWIAAFQAITVPELGHWLASALACLLVFLIGREMDGLCAGFIAGMLTACSPGIAIFSNLLLSHQPTLVALLLALLGAVRFAKRTSLLDVWLCSSGLGYGLLCRPLTAAAWGGGVLLWLITLNYRANGMYVRLLHGRYVKCAVAACVPIAAAGLAQAACNHQITGNWALTAYIAYQERHTPSHRYGFDNALRPPIPSGDKVLHAYDRWAINLTPAVALSNARKRLWRSIQYAMSPEVILSSICVFVVLLAKVDSSAAILLELIAAVHLVYVPYWFVGILEMHYVFETLPLWALIVGCTTSSCFRVWMYEARHLMIGWWTLFLVVTVCWNVVGSGPVPPLKLGLRRFSWFAERYRAFKSIVSKSDVRRPALILIDPAFGDVQVEFIVNDPDLENSVIYGRFKPDVITTDLIRKWWPQRFVYVMYRKDGVVVQLAEPTSTGRSD